MDGVVLVSQPELRASERVHLPRAFRLVFGEKAEVIEYDHQMIPDAADAFRAPSVIRLQYQIRRPRPRVKLIAAGDLRPGSLHLPVLRPQSHDLTLDHIVPRHRGGGHTWENLVTACKACNHRKGGKTLDEARFRLLARRSNRAAMSTRCSRPICPTTGTRPGGRTCSSAETDADPTPARGEGSLGSRTFRGGPRTARDALGRRPLRVCRRRLAARLLIGRQPMTGI